MEVCNPEVFINGVLLPIPTSGGYLDPLENFNLATIDGLLADDEDRSKFLKVLESAKAEANITIKIARHEKPNFIVSYKGRMTYKIFKPDSEGVRLVIVWLLYEHSLEARDENS
jgi:hypothetical protein